MNVSPHRDFIADRNHAVTPTPVAANAPTPRVATQNATCGSGWYHEVAIQESQQAPARKH